MDDGHYYSYDCHLYAYTQRVAVAAMYLAGPTALTPCFHSHETDDKNNSMGKIEMAGSI